MTESGLERILERLFDYAGMFPPAELTFEEALRRAAAFPRGLRRPHMVNARMVLTLAELPHLTQDAVERAGFPPGSHVPVALVGVPLEHAERAVHAIRALHADAERSDVVRRVVSLEVTSPAAPDGLGTLLPLLGAARAAAGVEGSALYLEPRWEPSAWDTGLDPVLGLLERARSTEGTVGLKVRAAGPTALDAPRLARVVCAVADSRLPFKVTQGLHHPIVEPQWNNTVGFLGLAVALHLRRARGAAFTARDALAALTERSAGSFAFDRGITWRAHRLDGRALADGLTVPFAIGSCSLDEPDEDLRRLFDAEAEHRGRRSG